MSVQLNPLDVKVGAQPIIWSNDDFTELGGNIELETCLEEMKTAGYAGTELGRKFPKDPTELKRLLTKYDLELISGWHSTYLLAKNYQDERKKFRSHLTFLKEMECSVAIVAECTHRVYHNRSAPLDYRTTGIFLKEAQFKKLAEGLEEFSKMAANEGMKLVYHHHMGTVIQTLEEIESLLDRVPNIYLLADTGHLAFAGVEPLDVFERNIQRIAHVHLKNIRNQVGKTSTKNKSSFEQAVKAGVFTVPGADDGGIDYLPILKCLSDGNYRGWLVVEAEQDPIKANPLDYAKKARDYLREQAGL